MDDKYDPPKATLGDHAHTLTRAGVASTPMVGGAANELFQAIIALPLQKRQAEWMKAVAEGLRKLESETLKLEDLAENEEFIDTVLHASQAAIRNSQQEKREALRNAVLNSATPASPDADLQALFVNLVDAFTPLHLRLLKGIDPPPPQPGEAVSVFGSHDYRDILKALFPDSESAGNLIDSIMHDLDVKGLIKVHGRSAGVDRGGVIPGGLSPLGKQFLEFISSPLLDESE